MQSVNERNHRLLGIVEVFKLCVCAFVVNMMDFCVSEQFRTIAERMRWGKICGKSEEGECKSHTE